jgi:hypothetical protein
MSQSSTPPASGKQELSVEEQYFAGLPLARLMVEHGITPFPEFGLAEFDASALLFAHSAGRLTLRPEILDAVIRISRGEKCQPNRAVQRDIDAHARKLFSRSEATLAAMQSQAPAE